MVHKTLFITLFKGVLITLIIGALIALCSCGKGAPLLLQKEGLEIINHDTITSSYMIAGSGGYDYGYTIEDSMHTQFGINCMNNCHMTPTMEWEDSNSDIYKLTSAGGVENVSVCNRCHPPAVGMGLKTFNSSRFNRAPIGNYDGDESAEGVQDEVQGLLDLLFNAIQASGVRMLDKDPFWENITTNEQKHALYNWLFVRNDKSLGVHNTARSVQLLQLSYKDLTGREVPGAEPYSHVKVPEPGESFIVIEPVMEMDGVIKDGNLIKSTALPNVGTGSYVFLKGFCRTVTPDNPAVSTEWSLIPPEGSEAVIKKVDNEHVYFIADKMAWYEVKLLVTDSKGVTNEGSLRIHSAPYVGVGGVAGDIAVAPECASCHPGGSKNTAETIHSKAFGYYIDGCDTPDDLTFGEKYLSYYTLGYNPDAANGGFDDVAAKTGWTFPGPEMYVPGNWEAMPLELKQMAGVQCESCHGPGGRWTGASISLSAQSCGYCHDSPIRNNKYEQWEKSAHAHADFITYNISFTENNEACNQCHSPEAFIDLTAGKKGSLRRFAGRTGIQPITCAVCHDPHEAKNKYQLRVYDIVTLPDGTSVINAGASAVCMMCHNGIVNADQITESERWILHFSTAAEMITGTGGYDYGKPLDNSRHKNIGLSCVDCHMAPMPGFDENKPLPGHGEIGSHTFRLTSEDGIENLSACINCHTDISSFDRKAEGDYDGNGMIEGVREEVSGLLNILLSAIQDSGAVHIDTEPFWKNINTEAQKKAVYNWTFVSHDRSQGIHNTIRSIQLLQRSYKDLTNNVVPGADLP